MCTHKPVIECVTAPKSKYRLRQIIARIFPCSSKHVHYNLSVCIQPWNHNNSRKPKISQCSHFPTKPHMSQKECSCNKHKEYMGQSNNAHSHSRRRMLLFAQKIPFQEEQHHANQLWKFAVDKYIRK